MARRLYLKKMKKALVLTLTARLLAHPENPALAGSLQACPQAVMKRITLSISVPYAPIAITLSPERPRVSLEPLMHAPGQTPALPLPRAPIIQYEDPDGRILGALDSLAGTIDTYPGTDAKSLLDRTFDGTHERNRIMSFVERFAFQSQYKKIARFASELDLNPDTHVLLFRGQNLYTERVLAKKARKEGLSHSKQYLATLLAALEAGERVQDLTPLDIIVGDHKTGMFEQLFVSTSEDLEVAMGDFALATTMNYVYILAVPKSVAIPRWRVRHKVDPNPRSIGLLEREYAVAHEATSYVKAIFNMKTGEFVKR